ncbi:Hypothetical predicted protein, partial [Olea europaea subsp. europaea]
CLLFLGSSHLRHLTAPNLFERATNTGWGAEEDRLSRWAQDKFEGGSAVRDGRLDQSSVPDLLRKIHIIPEQNSVIQARKYPMKEMIRMQNIQTEDLLRNTRRM